jgi:hypothetical protein
MRIGCPLGRKDLRGFGGFQEKDLNAPKQVDPPLWKKRKIFNYLISGAILTAGCVPGFIWVYSETRDWPYSLDARCQTLFRHDKACLAQNYVILRRRMDSNLLVRPNEIINVYLRAGRLSMKLTLRGHRVRSCR